MPYADGGLCPMPSRTSYESSKGYTVIKSLNPQKTLFSSSLRSLRPLRFKKNIPVCKAHLTA